MLIVRVGAMGDILHALPAVTALHRLAPAIPIGWIVDPRWAPLLAGTDGRGPVVSRLHLAETKLWSGAPWSAATWRSVLQLRRDLQAFRYASVIDMQGTLRSAVLGRFAAAIHFSGYSDPRERPARWLYRRPLPRSGRHVVQQGAALLGEALGFPALGFPALGFPDLGFPAHGFPDHGLALEPVRTVELPRLPEAERWAEETVAALPPAALSPERRFALLAPTAGWGAKQWPAERFGALAAELRQAGLAVLVNASSADDPVAAAVVAASAGAARVAAGGVPGLLALTRRAALVVGGDSGPVHLAATLGTPLVGLFGPTDPERNGPWGAGPMRVLRHPTSVTTYKRTAETEAGLAQIDVGTALRAALDVLSEAGTQAPGSSRPVSEI